MPNIIEQQDLLKGLPDARLAMLLQNPVADIPPFLVAAEAQRRQAIRQQFAGSENKESVVDSLTKQLAKVPQNIPAPMNPPPSVPPTPEMQGVAALQAQQAMQAAAQPQGMRAGGMVQRYQSRGLVVPTVESLSSGYYVDPFGAPDISEGDTGAFSDLFPDLGLPPLFPQWKTEEEIAAEKEKNAGFAPPKPRLRPDDLIKSVPTKPRPEEKEAPKPEPGETEDEFRARIEALYATPEPSDWEKSQRWFAMAEQFLDPSKTNMQSIAGAGRAFAEQSAAMDAARREADINRQKALLEYDVSERDRVRAAEAERAKREYETQQKILERRNPPAADVLRTLGSLVEDIDKRIASMSELGSSATPEDIKRLEAQKNAYMIQMAEILRSAGYGPGGAITMDQLEALAGQ